MTNPDTFECSNRLKGHCNASKGGAPWFSDFFNSKTFPKNNLVLSR